MARDVRRVRIVIAIATSVVMGALVFVLYAASFRIADPTTWILVLGKVGLLAACNAIPVLMRMRIPTRVTVTSDGLAIVTLTGQRHRSDGTSEGCPWYSGPTAIDRARELT